MQNLRLHKNLYSSFRTKRIYLCRKLIWITWMMHRCKSEQSSRIPWRTCSKFSRVILIISIRLFPLSYLNWFLLCVGLLFNSLLCLNYPQDHYLCHLNNFHITTSTSIYSYTNSYTYKREGLCVCFFLITRKFRWPKTKK